MGAMQASCNFTELYLFSYKLFCERVSHWATRKSLAAVESAFIVYTAQKLNLQGKLRGMGTVGERREKIVVCETENLRNTSL